MSQVVSAAAGVGFSLYEDFEDERLESERAVVRQAIEGLENQPEAVDRARWKELVGKRVLLNSMAYQRGLIEEMPAVLPETPPPKIYRHLNPVEIGTWQFFLEEALKKVNSRQQREAEIAQITPEEWTILEESIQKLKTRALDEIETAHSLSPDIQNIVETKLKQIESCEGYSLSGSLHKVEGQLHRAKERAIGLAEKLIHQNDNLEQPAGQIIDRLYECQQQHFQARIEMAKNFCKGPTLATAGKEDFLQSEELYQLSQSSLKPELLKARKALLWAQSLESAYIRLKEGARDGLNEEINALEAHLLAVDKERSRRLTQSKATPNEPSPSRRGMSTWFVVISAGVIAVMGARCARRNEFIAQHFGFLRVW